MAEVLDQEDYQAGAASAFLEEDSSEEESEPELLQDAKVQSVEVLVPLVQEKDTAPFALVDSGSSHVRLGIE